MTPAVTAFILGWCLFPAAASAGSEPGRLALVTPRGALPTIVVGAEATASERFAAEELATYLEKITGKKLATVDDARVPPGKLIAVGNSKLTESLDTAALDVEQYIIDVAPRRLTLVGGRLPPLAGGIVRDRGTLYGVYDFLEQLGVRWYRPEPWGEHVPKLDRIMLPVRRTVSRRPDYVMRSGVGGGYTRYREIPPEMAARTSLWAARNRLNWSDVGSDPKYGGRVYYHFYHTYAGLIPPEKYFAEHPEYFALINGKRSGERGAQLCLGNPEVQKLFAEKVVELAKANPYWDSVSAEPNDGAAWCECDLCRAMDDPVNPRLMSNRVCAFNNMIARRLAEEAPGMKVHWLAYSAHTVPPTIVAKLEPNTIVQPATINEWGDYSKRLDDPAANWNQGFAQALRGWAALGPSALMTYEYWSGYGWPGPLPLARTIADRLRSYREFNVRGVYNETSPSWGPQGLELYLFAKLIWNPDLDLQRELNLYYANFYGPAAKPMKAYHEALMDALEKHPYPVYSGGRAMGYVLTPALVEDLGRHIEEAQTLVKGQPLYEKRLEGVVAGYEFAQRVSDLLKLKKAKGVETPIPGSRGSYLACPEAEQAFEDLKQFLLTFGEGDAVFDISSKPPHAASLAYMPDDLLKNGALSFVSEADLLRDF